MSHEHLLKFWFGLNLYYTEDKNKQAFRNYLLIT